MAEKSFNPYGSAISRTGLFVYDPTKAVEKSLAIGQKAFEEPLKKLEAQRAQDIQYAQDIFDNLGELLDQGELEHNARINEEVNRLVEETKSNMVVRGKAGGIKSFNFNNPEFQAQLQTGIKRVKNGINNSKLLKAQYNDLVTFLNTNKDVVSNQIGIINEAAAKLTNTKNLFTSNDVVSQFTSLKNNAIDEVKYINNIAQGLLDVTDKQTLTYEAVDSRGKNITIAGEFNKDIYVTDEMGVIQRDSNGKPQLDIERVKALRDGIKEDPMTPPQAVEWLKNDANFEQFKDMITADLIIKERTQKEQADIDYRKAATRAQNRSNRSEEITTKKLFNISTSNEFKLYDAEGTELSGNNTAKYVNIDEDDYLKEQTLGGIPIPRVVGIGYQNGKKALVIRRGDDNVVVTAGSNYTDAFDTEVLVDLTGKDLIISEQDMNQTWDSVNTTARTDSFKGDDTEMYENTLNNALVLSKNTQSNTFDANALEFPEIDNLNKEKDKDDETEPTIKEKLTTRKKELEQQKSKNNFLNREERNELKNINDQLDDIAKEEANLVVDEVVIEKANKIVQDFNKRIKDEKPNDKQYDEMLKVAKNNLIILTRKQNDATSQELDIILEQFDQIT